MLLGILALCLNGSTDAMSELTAEGISQGTLIAAGLVMALSGLLSVITGIFGLRAAKDARKAGPVFILAIVSVISALVSLFTLLISSNFQFSDLTNLVVSCLLVWCVNNVKKQSRT